MASRTRAFTLVEILIVVVILGILAAVVIPNFVRTTEDAATNTTISELAKLRRHIEVFRIRNQGLLPNVTDGDGTWGEIVGNTGEYLLAAPINPWVGGPNARVIVVVPNAEPDTAYQTDYGWIYDPVNGEVYAGSFDAAESPLPRE